MNGESNIKHMMLGLANNGVDFKGKKIIAILYASHISINRAAFLQPI